MNKKKIVFRTITEPSRGFGNLMRSITLAEALRKKSYKIFFLINHNLNSIQELNKKKFDYKIIPNFTSKKREVEYISKWMNSKYYTSIILDMREYGENISKHFLNKDFQVVLLDDAWCKNAYANLIINGTNVKQYARYKKINKDSKIFADSKYWIINEEFKKNKKKISDIRHKKKYTIIVSVGGADPHGLSLLITQSLLEVPNIQIIVIIGPFFKETRDLSVLAKTYDNIQILKSPPKIWKELRKADIAISASGNTLYELSVLQIPTICIVAEPHQLPYANFFSSKGFCLNLGSKDELTLTRIRNIVSSLLENHQKRKKMSLSAKKIIDGKGLPRVVKVVDNFLKKIHIED